VCTLSQFFRPSAAARMTDFARGVWLPFGVISGKPALTPERFLALSLPLNSRLKPAL
jgi:hypothetical protein